MLVRMPRQSTWCDSSSRSGELFSIDFGGDSRKPPEISDRIQCNPERHM